MATKPAITKTTNPSGMRIIKKGTCGMIAPSSSGQLTYDVGFQEKDKTFHFRVTGNTGGGYFSKEWVSLVAIQERIEAQPPGQPFKSLILRKVYVSTGANNYGFLSAVLRKEGLLLPVPKKPFSHLVGDAALLMKAMQPALKAKTDLEDEVTIEEAEKAKVREQRAAAMQKALAVKARGKPMQTASATASKRPVKKAPRKPVAKSA